MRQLALLLLFLSFPTFAAERDPCDQAIGRFVINADGSRGGFVADTARVERVRFSRRVRPYIGPHARVCQEAQVLGDARVEEVSVVAGRATVSQQAVIRNSRIFGTVSSTAQVNDSVVDSESIVDLNARIDTSEIRNSTVRGNSNIHLSEILDRSLVSGNSHIERSVIRGSILFDQHILHQRQPAADGVFITNAGDHGDESDPEESPRTNTESPPPLRYAASFPAHHRIEISASDAEALAAIDDSCDFNLMRPDGKTILQIAVEKHFWQTAQTLITFGANPNPMLYSELRAGRFELLELVLGLEGSKLERINSFLQSCEFDPRVLNLVVTLVLDRWYSKELVEYFDNLRREQIAEFSPTTEKALEIEMRLPLIIERLQHLYDTHCKEHPTPGEETKHIELVKCPLCLESGKAENPKYRFANCSEISHRFACDDCFPAFLKKAMVASECPLRCPNRCGGYLEVTDLKRYAAHPGSESLELIERKYVPRLLQKKLLNAAPERFKPCFGHPYCINVIDLQTEIDTLAQVKCGACDEVLCMGCFYVHPNDTCDAFQAKRKKEEKEDARRVHDPKSDEHPCPWCYVPTFKYDACDHMTCEQCKKTWDWLLGRTQGPNHYARPGEPRTYRVPGDINPKTGKVYTAYVDQVED